MTLTLSRLPSRETLKPSDGNPEWAGADLPVETTHA